MAFVSIVWNYFEDIPIDICQYMMELTSVEEIILLRPNNYYNKLVQEIYDCHKINQIWINNKISVMDKLPKKDILAITHNFIDPKIFYDPILNRYISQSAQQFKENIRDKFNFIYGCDLKTPIIHSTDNEIESHDLLQVIDKYKQICFYKLIPIIKM